MLGAIEQVVLNALRAAPPVVEDVVGGASASPPATKRIGVHARSLTCDRPLLSEPDTIRREPVWLSRRSVILPDNDLADPTNARNFTLPADALPDVVEVQSPPGTLLKQGDDFSVDGRIIRFYYNNTPSPIEVVTQGGHGNGYVECTACRIDLELSVWASDGPTADALSVVALERALAAFANRTVVVIAWDPTAGFRVRLLSTRAYLSSVTREARTVDWANCTTRLTVCGELEIALASGAADPAGVIRNIIYKA